MITTGLKAFIQSESHWNVVFSANSIKETLENLDKKFGENYTFQIGELFALVDMRLGDDDGFELVEKLTARGIRCVMYSMFGAPSFVLKAMQVGAFGYVLKENDDRCIIQALESAFVYHGITLLIPIHGVLLPLSNFIFIICSLTVVFGVRIFCREKIDILRLILLSLFLTIIISLEGGIIFSTVYASPEPVTMHSVDRKILSVIYQKTTLLVGAALMRIPINLIDKTLAVVLEFGIALGVEKIGLRIKN